MEHDADDCSAGLPFVENADWKTFTSEAADEKLKFLSGCLVSGRPVHLSGICSGTGKRYHYLWVVIDRISYGPSFEGDKTCWIHFMSTAEAETGPGGSQCQWAVPLKELDLYDDPDDSEPISCTLCPWLQWLKQFFS